MVTTSQRKAIESLYLAVCDIHEYKSIQDEDSGITTKKLVLTIAKQPCRLSYKNVYPTDSNRTADTVRQITKLFLAPELTIKAGSLIIVTQHGKTTTYKNSGYPEIHSTHQELIVELFDKRV